MLTVCTRALAIAALTALVTLVPSVAAAQTQLTVFLSGAMTQPVREVGAEFAKTTGTKVVYVGDTTGGLLKRAAAGEKVDLIVVAAPAMATLEKEKRIAAGSRVDLARALIGVGVRAGAASPDLSTVDTFRAALLAAKSVSYVNPAAGGTSGTYFEGLLSKLGIADAMKSKTVYRTQGSEVAAAVAAGDAEIGITFTSELKPNAGVKVAGTLPDAIQLPTIYTAAVSASSTNAAGARLLLRALGGAEGRTAISRIGLEPLP
jgi:molybdate transport system substrate-binding protein